MAFLNNDSVGDQTNTENTGNTDKVVEDNQVEIGGNQYSHDDLEKLVGFKDQLDDIDKNHGGLNKLVSEFGRRGDNLGKVRKELEELKETHEAIQTPKLDPNDAVARQTARDQAKSLGIMLDDDKSDLISKDDFRNLYLQEREAEKLIDKTNDLEGQIDGNDGRPAFKKQEIFEYMAESGIRDPQIAYNTKYQSQVDEWRANQIIRSKKGGLITNDVPTSAKTPEKVNVTHDNLHDLISESLNSL